MKKLLILFLFIPCIHFSLKADDIWPWSVKFNVSKGEEVVENEASLWMANPERPVRGIIMTSMVRNEVDFNYSEEIRAAASEQDLALLFFYNERSGDFYTGGALSVFDLEKGHDTVIFNVLNKFADITGKPEMAHAPWMTFGHSTAGIFAKSIAWWKPERMFGVIFYKTGGYHPPEWLNDPDTAAFLNVPWLSVAARNDKFGPGENGWKTMRKDMMPWRERGSLMSQIVEPTMEEGHSLWRPFNAPYFAMWIKKAAEKKIPKDTTAIQQPLDLHHIKNASGMLSDTLLEHIMDSASISEDLLRFHYDVSPEDRGAMFWHFDDEMAITWVNYHHKAFEEFDPMRDTTQSGKVKFWFRKDPLAFDSDNPDLYDSTVIMGMNADGIVDSSYISLPDQYGEFNIINYNRQLIIHRDMAGSYANPVVSASLLDYINGMDAYLLEEIISEQDDFIIPSVFQIWAADINMDGMVDTEDLEQLTKRAVLKLPEFKQEWNYGDSEVPLIDRSSLDWVFFDSTKTRFNKPTRLSETYPQDDGEGYSRHRIPPVSDTVVFPYEIGNPYPVFEEGIFYGVMLGDIDGSFAQSEEIGNETKIIIDLSKTITYGDSISVPMWVESADAVYAADVRLKAATGFTIHRFRTMEQVKHASNQIDNTAYLISWAPDGIQTDTAFAWIISEDEELIPEDITEAAGYVNGEKCAIEFVQKTAFVQRAYTSGITLYPVPSTDYLWLKTSDNKKGKIHIHIYDQTGRQVLSELRAIPDSQDVRINISGLENGMYVIKVIGTDKSYSGVFTIEP